MVKTNTISKPMPNRNSGTRRTTSINGMKEDKIDKDDITDFKIFINGISQDFVGVFGLIAKRYKGGFVLFLYPKKEKDTRIQEYFFKMEIPLSKEVIFTFRDSLNNEKYCCKCEKELKIERYGS